MHIHKINIEKHSAFLKENRQDPITGDLIEEGDEVVFCASCKSAFLKDTWLYLDKKHCNQSRTIKKPTFGQSLILARAKQETVFIPLEGAKSFKKFSKQTKNSYWTSEYESIKNNIKVYNEREGAGLILLLGMVMYVVFMFYFGVSVGLFGLVSSPVLLLLARQYINLVYSSNTDKAMLGVGESELMIYFSEKRQKSFIPYKQVEKVIITYQSEDKSVIEIKDKNNITIRTELQTVLIKKFLTSVSERNKETLIELVSFPENYQNHNLFWQLQENPLLRLV
ncbi:MAG: hypothetical protein COZ18_11355 [Flexibacter sp. CG_4_10_14_3_um_filter_32_15]|nr:MAG: hypothetical protein COZ18_11355 [Flexibacter sp. CG_4_10_14_3_um_filter_32_15]